MNSVDMFFQVVLLFCLLLSSIMVIVGVITTISTFKAAKRDSVELDFNPNSFFVSVVMPILYMISFAIVYSGVVV
jgi:hypothetical protein